MKQNFRLMKLSKSIIIAGEQIFLEIFLNH